MRERQDLSSSSCEALKQQLLKSNGRFSIAEASALINQIYDECAISTKIRFHNQFFYEVCPLFLIAEHLSDKVKQLSFLGNSHAFDGMLYFYDDTTQRIEVTTAIDGENDALAMELLDKQGHSPAFQKIEASGTKRNRIFGKNNTEAIRQDTYDAVLLDLFGKSIKRKMEKSKTNLFYHGAWLCIVFDDWICPVDDKKARRFDPLCEAALSFKRDSGAPFTRVFFVGVSRKYLFDSKAL